MIDNLTDLPPLTATHIDVKQRSPEWYTIKAGKLSSSTAHLPFAKGRGTAESVEKRDLRIKLACEQLTGLGGDDPDAWKGPWVARGIELEDSALAAYEAFTGHVVWRPGFLLCDTLAFGTSLDAAVGADVTRCVEMKVPKPAVHLSYVRNPLALQAEYEHQVLTHLLLTKAEYCDLVSFCPSAPAGLQLLVCELHRDVLQNRLVAFELGVRTFLDEVTTLREELAQLAASRLAQGFA